MSGGKPTTKYSVIPIPVAWYIVGPAMGLTMAGLYAVTNNHLGISGSYVQIIDRLRGRPLEAWRLWFHGGTIVGAALVAVLGGHPQTGLGYGRLGEITSLPTLIALLIFGGALIGYGARWAGGCTFGHGLTGCTTRSPGSLAAVITFMVTAVGVTLLLHQLTGGQL